MEFATDLIFLLPWVSVGVTMNLKYLKKGYFWQWLSNKSVMAWNLLLLYFHHCSSWKKQFCCFRQICLVYVSKNTCRGVVVMNNAQLHSTKPEFKFCSGSNPALNVMEIRDGKDLWQWSRLEIRLNAFCRSTTKTIHHHHHQSIIN